MRSLSAHRSIAAKHTEGDMKEIVDLRLRQPVAEVGEQLGCVSSREGGIEPANFETEGNCDRSGAL